MSSPKVFISYSWSSEEHEAWVTGFAEQLMQAGVTTIFDKWDLQPGHDAFKFMEQMVNDPTIDKVLIVSDEEYSKKANARGDSGVSAETQIISPAIYAGASQDKFIAIVTQRDGTGKAFVPTYYASKIYIDFSNPGEESESFEKLIRFIFGQPLHKRPPLGNPPSYLTTPSSPSLGTTVAFNRAYSALKDAKNYAEGAVEEFFTTFLSNLSRFRMSFVDKADEEKINITSDSIDALIPYRNEAVKIFEAIAQYSPTPNLTKRVHRFFESYSEYIFPPSGGRHTDWDCDNFKFLGRELFLHFIAIFIKHERFEELGEFLADTYFIRSESARNSNRNCDHSIFNWYLSSLEYKNKKEKIGKTSLPATYLKDRSGAGGVTFIDLMQADVVLYLRALINKAEGLDSGLVAWYPDSCVYVGHHADAMEIFARAESSRYFGKIRPLFSGWDKIRIIEMTASMVSNDHLPKWGWQSLPIQALIGAEKLDTRP